MRDCAAEPAERRNQIDNTFQRSSLFTPIHWCHNGFKQKNIGGCYAFFAQLASHKCRQISS